jgi:hypothetical protein
MMGPASSAAGNLAVFRDPRGKEVKDGGTLASVLATALTGLAETTDLPDGVEDYVFLS